MNCAGSKPGFQGSPQQKNLPPFKGQEDSILQLVDQQHQHHGDGPHGQLLEQGADGGHLGQQGADTVGGQHHAENHGHMDGQGFNGEILGGFLCPPKWAFY